MKFFYCLTAILLPVLALHAQRSIHGTVSGKNNLPVAGATVSLQRTGSMLLTDAEGAFTINVLSTQDTLLISHISYRPALIIIPPGTPEININLTEITGSLDEVVVIGYGTTTQRFNTGSVVKVTGDDIQKQPVANPLAALAGRVPGLTVTQNNGVPGSFYRVLIRGQSSLSQGSEPLFVIDGVPFAPNNTPVNQLSSAAATYAGSGISPFNSINPADIESIEVLKDADATSIYGSRGANGVILITTKKGKAGKTLFSLNAYTGNSVITRNITMLNTNAYLQMRHEAFRNDGVIPDINTAPDLFAWDTTRYTNFPKLLIGGHANTSDVQASVSGGNNNTRFLLSGTWHHESTVFPGNLADNRAAVNLGVNHTSPNQKFTLAVSALYSLDKNAIIARDITSFISLPPNAPELYDADGNLNWQEGGVLFNNPLAYLQSKYTAVTGNLLSNVNAGYNVLPGLTIKISAGYNAYDINEVNINPISSQNPAYAPQGYSLFGNNYFKSWIIEPQAEYKKNIKKLKLNLLAGGTWQKTVNSYSSLFAYGYTNDALLESMTAASSLSAINSNKTDYRYEALFGRGNLNWNDLYILTVTGRRDGSSRFGPGKQFANFGSAGAAWIFSGEPFLKKLSFLSYGKLRGSYGTTGNDQIGDYQYLDTWTAYYYTYQDGSGLYPTRLFNPDYSWEVNRKTELALELGFLQDRILFTGAWFKNRGSNQLVQYQLPLQTGFSGVLKNFPATVQNTGLELSLTTKNIAKVNFEWSTTFNITLPKNKLVSFPGLDASSYANRYVIGHSVNVQKGFDFLGVNASTGIFEYNDINKDGILDVNDFVILGDTDPDYYGGFLNTISYKGFEADIFFEFKKQLGKNYLYSVYMPYGYIPGTMSNQPSEVSSRWQQPGDKTNIQQYTATFGTPAFNAVNYFPGSGAVYSDASYLRLKNVAVSYSFQPGLLHKYHITYCRVYLQGQNLLTITGYKVADPETQNMYALPPLKTLTAGIQFTF